MGKQPRREQYVGQPELWQQQPLLSITGSRMPRLTLIKVFPSHCRTKDTTTEAISSALASDKLFNSFEKQFLNLKRLAIKFPQTGKKRNII